MNILTLLSFFFLSSLQEEHIFQKGEYSPHSHAAIIRMAWQWAETPVEIRGNIADIKGTTK